MRNYFKIPMSTKWMRTKKKIEVASNHGDPKSSQHQKLRLEERYTKTRTWSREEKRSGIRAYFFLAALVLSESEIAAESDGDGSLDLDDVVLSLKLRLFLLLLFPNFRKKFPIPVDISLVLCLLLLLQIIIRKSFSLFLNPLTKKKVFLFFFFFGGCWNIKRRLLFKLRHQ